ncbi:MAG: ATPase, T2SS/T4P/T4SS family [Schlesneria sp.]
MPKLLGPGAANGVEITFGGVIVGRERGCDIVLRSKNVSRNHARVTFREQVSRVEDLGSSNGTKVNGVLIKGITELHVGDLITFGDMTLQIVNETPHAVQSDPTTPTPPAFPICPGQPDLKATSSVANSGRTSLLNRHERPAVLNDTRPSRRDEIDSSAKTRIMRPQRTTYALEACVILLALNLLFGFFAGRIAQRMGSIKLPGEISARENLVAPTPIQNLTSTTVDQQTSPGTVPSVGLPGQRDLDNEAVSKSTISGSGKVNQGITEASILDRAEGQDAPTSSNSMSTADSAKAIRLLREVERAGVDLGDTEAVLKIANQKLGMTPDQTRRVVKFVKLLADRKALIEGGGLNFNLDSKPKTKSTTQDSTSITAVNTNPTPANSTPQSGGSQNVNEPRLGMKSQEVASNQGLVDQPDGNQAPAVAGTGFASNPSFIMSVNRGVGYYINLWGLLLILGLAFAWQQSVYWMGADCSQTGIDGEIWPIVACAAGPVGTISALCCPDLGLGIMLDCVCLATPFLGYVAFRDEKVPEEDRVLQFLSWFDFGNVDQTNQQQVREELNNLSELGFDRKLQGELRDIVALPQGLLLVCGPTGAGKSTTLRCALAELDPQAVKIITIEDPIEYRIAGVTQFEFDSTRGQSYSRSIQRALRKDAEVLMVEEILDGEAAIAVCQAATSGHMMLSTVPVNDTQAAIQCLIDLGVDADSLANGLTAVLGQRMVRRLCVECKEQYTPEAELLRRYRIPADHESTFYRPPGRDVKCEACDGTGYHGHVGVFELLRIDDTVRTLIRERGSPSQIRSAARRRGMTTLRENGFRLVIRGVTSLDEVYEATRDYESLYIQTRRSQNMVGTKTQRE